MENIFHEEPSYLKCKNSYVVLNISIKSHAPRVTIDERSLKRILIVMVPGYQNFEGDGVGISDLKRVTPEKVDSSDKEVEKKAHSKKDEEIEKITQL